MKILYDDSADQLSGSIGGQYFQTSVNTPSIRTKRNGGNLYKSYSLKQRSAVAYLSGLWRSLSDLQKLAFLAGANSSNLFNFTTESDLQRAWLFFFVTNSKRISYGLGPRLVTGSTISTPDLVWEITAASRDPLIISGSQTVYPAGVFNYISLNVQYDFSDDLIRPLFHQVSRTRGIDSVFSINSNRTIPIWGGGSSAISAQVKVYAVSDQSRWCNVYTSNRVYF